MRYAIRVGGRYFVGFCGHDPIYSKRSYFAELFGYATHARTFVRTNLRTFAHDIDACCIVRLKPRTTEEIANAE